MNQNYIFIVAIILMTTVNLSAQKQSKIEMWYAEANYLQNHGNPKKGIKLYSKILKKDPDHFLAINNRSLCYDDLNDFGNALAGYKRLEEIDSSRGMIYLNKAITLRKLEKYDEAMLNFNKAERLEGTRLDLLYYNMGIAVTYALNNYDSAIYYYNRSIDENPEFILAYTNKAYAYFKQEKWSRALVTYERTIQMGAERSVTFNNLGYCYLKENNHARALFYFEKSLNQFPENPWCYRNIGHLHMELQDKPKACENLKKALQQGFLKEWGKEWIEELMDYCKDGT